MVNKIESDLIKFRLKLAALDGINGDMSRQRTHYRCLISECERILSWLRGGR
jgi:hypothetical protein